MSEHGVRARATVSLRERPRGRVGSMLLEHALHESFSRDKKGDGALVSSQKRRPASSCKNAENKPRNNQLSRELCFSIGLNINCRTCLARRRFTETNRRYTCQQPEAKIGHRPATQARALSVYMLICWLVLPTIHS